MITYVHTQLSVWGKAQAIAARRGLGFPSVCPMFRDVKHGGVYGSTPPLGVTLTARADIDDTAAAVARLGDAEKRLVTAYYVLGLSGAAVARECGFARQRFNERLAVIHQQLLGLLNDVAAGI